jgi:hypothetical protein
MKMQAEINSQKTVDERTERGNLEDIKTDGSIILPTLDPFLGPQISDYFRLWSSGIRHSLADRHQWLGGTCCPHLQCIHVPN